MSQTRGHQLVWSNFDQLNHLVKSLFLKGSSEKNVHNDGVGVGKGHPNTDKGL